MPIWAAVISNTAENCVYLFLINETPTYLSGWTNSLLKTCITLLITQAAFHSTDTMGFSLEKLGVISAVPYLMLTFTSQISGYLADTLRNKYRVKTTTVYSTPIIQLLTFACRFVDCSFVCIFILSLSFLILFQLLSWRFASFFHVARMLSRQLSWLY